MFCSLLVLGIIGVLAGILHQGFSPRSTPIRVAIIDGGIDVLHPSLDGVEIQKFVVPELSSGISDHATGMASIFVKEADLLSRGRQSPVILLDVKALSDGGVGEAEDLAVGITLAAEQGANIIICSLSVEMDSPVLREAVAAAYENGAVILAAAGNGIGEFSSYPADYEQVLSVGALDQNNKRLRFTNRSDVDLLAPGQNIRGATGLAEFSNYSGISPATAAAAGTLARCWEELDPQLLYRTSPNASISQAIAQSIKHDNRRKIECLSN